MYFDIKNGVKNTILSPNYVPKCNIISLQKTKKIIIQQQAQYKKYYFQCYLLMGNKCLFEIFYYK